MHGVKRQFRAVEGNENFHGSPLQSEHSIRRHRACDEIKRPSFKKLRISPACSNQKTLRAQYVTAHSLRRVAKFCVRWDESMSVPDCPADSKNIVNSFLTKWPFDMGAAVTKCI